MKIKFTLLSAVFVMVGVFAQTPEKMSYQAVIRNSSDALVINTQVGMQISILLGTADGSPMYIETQTPTTNANGLVSIEIGNGSIVSGVFSTIDWSNGPYFIKTETDPAGGVNYTITGTSQLLSVPYALHAKTAETVTESDPLFTSWDKTTGISVTESQISDLGTYIETETDPLFMAWDKDYSDLTGIPAIPADLSDLTDNTSLLFSGNYNDLTNVPALFDGAFSSLTSIPTTIAGYGITDAFDGQYSSLTGTPANLSDFTNDVGYLNDYTVTQTDVTAHQGALSLTKSQISDLGSYIETETDPTVTKYSVGDFAQGGIVFWVDETGQHGLVAAKEDQGSGVRWYAGTDGNTQAKGDGPFAGEANTTIIIAAHVAIGDDGNTYAARICNELQVTEGGKTYSDWYLPSKEELTLMYQNKATIDNAAQANGGSAFASTLYWSSNEGSNTNAFSRYFYAGSMYDYSPKYAIHMVRAVRAF